MILLRVDKDYLEKLSLVINMNWFLLRFFRRGFFRLNNVTGHTDLYILGVHMASQLLEFVFI